MKRLLTVALLCISASALAAEKPAPKPSSEPKAETKTTPPKPETLKVEEPDQKDPKNKEVDVKARGEVKKDSL